LLAGKLTAVGLSRWETGKKKGRHTMTEQDPTPDIPGDDAEGHRLRPDSQDDSRDDTEGHRLRPDREADTGDDTEGHRWKP
jgi:hypothetical protein